LGFPYLTGGDISKRMQKEKLVKLLENKEDYYQSVFKKNKEYIKFKIDSF